MKYMCSTLIPWNSCIIRCINSPIRVQSSKYILITILLVDFVNHNSHEFSDTHIRGSALRKIIRNANTLHSSIGDQTDSHTAHSSMSWYFHHKYGAFEKCCGRTHIGIFYKIAWTPSNISMLALNACMRHDSNKSALIFIDSVCSSSSILILLSRAHFRLYWLMFSNRIRDYEDCNIDSHIYWARHPVDYYYASSVIPINWNLFTRIEYIHPNRMIWCEIKRW